MQQGLLEATPAVRPPRRRTRTGTLSAAIVGLPFFALRCVDTLGFANRREAYGAVGRAGGDARSGDHGLALLRQTGRSRLVWTAPATEVLPGFLMIG
jgi:hypothetical protein